jgi:hypothetical protein
MESGTARSTATVARGVEMGLSGAEIHQIDALRAQLGGLRGHSHGCGDLDPANAAGKDLGRRRDCHSTTIFTDFPRNDQARP